LSFNNCFSLGDIYYRLKRYEDALIVFEDLAAKHPQVESPKSMMAAIHYLLGNTEKAQSLLEQLQLRSAGLDLYSNERFIVAAHLGRKDLAQSRLEYLLNARSTKWVSPAIISMIFFALGQNDEGLSTLKLGKEENDPMLHMYGILPLLDKYRKLPIVQNFFNAWQADDPHTNLQ
jgi:tetratricopeptide (TPR) repeat protein